MSVRLTFPNLPPSSAPGTTRIWGMPDLPFKCPYPEVICADEDGEYTEPMTFICQINCQDLAPYDTGNLLPHTGLLSFFAAIDPYLALGDNDAQGYNGIGEWSADMFRVIYSEDTSDLKTHQILNADGSPYGLKAEAISFEQVTADTDGFRMLGSPYYSEVTEQTDEDLLLLLQIDEEDRWNLSFYDCGMLCFLITKENLLSRRFDNVRCYMHSF